MNVVNILLPILLGGSEVTTVGSIKQLLSNPEELGSLSSCILFLMLILMQHPE